MRTADEKTHRASSPSAGTSPQSTHTHDGKDRGRGAGVLPLAALFTATPILWWAGGSLWAQTGATAVAETERLIALSCTVAAAGLTAWWLLALSATAVWASALRRGDARTAQRVGRFAPAALRRLAATALGLSVVLAPGATAADVVDTRLPVDAVGITTPRDPAATTSAQSERHSVTDGPPSAAWIPHGQAPTAAFTPRQPRITVDAPSHTVTTGDCLWDIAATELGPDATVLEVDLRWRQWYRHNRSVIGEDPHALRAGLVLQAPPFDSDVPAAGVYSLR